MITSIYTRWRGQTEAEIKEQQHLPIPSGVKGTLRESNDGEPYASRYLCGEAFRYIDTKGARISAATLRERLPHALAIIEEQEKSVNQSEGSEIEEIKQNFSDFVSFCEQKENETGEPVTIFAVLNWATLNRAA